MDNKKERFKGKTGLCSGNRDKLSYSVPAYITVEMSLIFPIILGVLIVMIYLMFFMNGRVIISEHAYGEAVRATYVKKKELPDYFSQYEGYVKMRERLTGPWKGGSFISDEGRYSIKSEYNTSMYIPLIFIYDENLTHEAGYKVKGSAVNGDPVKFIRECRLIKIAINRAR